MTARRRNPIAALALVAAVPALVLAGVWKLADSQAGDATQGVAPSDSASSAAALDTPLLSVRRAPGTLARDVNVAAFTTALQPLLDKVGGSSCVAVAVNGQLVAAKNETVLVRPASTVKLLTARVALDVLGADFTFTTTVTGDVGDGGVVAGDLYLVGGGDPLLASTWWKGPSANYPEFNHTSIEALAQSVVDAGVTTVTGGIVGDASRYDEEWYAPTWPQDVRFSDGGPVSALLANDSRESPTKSSNDPVVGAAQVLIDELVARGVTVGGAASAGKAGSSKPVASINSIALPGVIAEMLTTSDNNTAELVLKEIALHETGTGSREAGLGVVRDKLAEWGIPTDGLTLVDGSGLSTEDEMTCTTMLGVLEHGTVDDAVGAGMPVGGAAGGTLSDAFLDAPLAGLIRAKTGTLNHGGAKALAGYVPLDGGGSIQFALILNGTTISNKTEYRPIWDDLASALGAYPAGPTVAALLPRS